MATPNAFDYFAIRNTIARYSLALDTQNWLLLKRVFTPDVDANYPFVGDVKGVDRLAGLIEKRLTPISSQHALTTQHIEVAADGKTAKAHTYFSGIHFGKGRWEGKDVTAWGSYEDTLVCLPAAPDSDQQDMLPGSSGRWLISKRHVGFMGRRGEEGVMTGEGGQ